MLTIQAASSADANVNTTAQDVINVLGIKAIRISAGKAVTVKPGAVVTFDHTVTNVGTVAAALQLSYQSANGWVVNGPATLNLAPGAAQDIQLQVTVPADAGGLIDVTTITVTPADNPEGTVQAQDAVIVYGAGVQLLPDRQGSVTPGQTMVYTHTVVNTGSAVDTFNLSYASSEGWTVNGPALVELEAGASKVIEVAVTMPQGSAPAVDVTTITATSTMDSRKQATVTDTTSGLAQRLYLPSVQTTSTVAR